MKRIHISSAWLPSVVALVSVSAVLVTWHALRVQEHAQIERVTKLATYSIRADMIGDMDVRIRGLVELAREWQIWEKPRKDEFTTRATLYISHTPGCVAIGWVNSAYAVNWMVPVDGDVFVRQLLSNAPSSVQEKLQPTLQSHAPLVGKAVQLSHNELFLPIWVPVFADDAFQGFLVGVFRVRTLLDDVTSDHADLGYEVVVSDEGNPIYILTNAIPENEWAQSANVSLPGREWQIRIWPGAKALPDTMPLSRVVLPGGLAMSLQLTLMVFLALRARVWARHVDAANRELTRENAERRRAEDSLHYLSGKLLNLQDEERRRIARELHDSTAQVLYGLTIKLKLLSKSLNADDPKSESALFESMELADQCVREIRTISYLLHPPSLDELGPLPAIRSLANGFTERSGIAVDLDMPADLGRLSRDIETALFRIVQESLSNVHRHSGSKTAAIRVARDANGITVRISDEGRGCPPEVLDQTSHSALGVGIAGMRERVRQLSGKLEIHSSPSGTHVIAYLPVWSDDVSSSASKSAVDVPTTATQSQ